MDIFLQSIGTYIPENRVENLKKLDKFKIDNGFIKNKIGFEELSIKGKEESVVDLCKKAYLDLEKKSGIDPQEVEAIILVSQNTDFNIPHTSAVLHKEINAPLNCACFDVSLGCSGYVYGLSILKSLMIEADLKNALLFTCDPYSKIINEDDKNTSLIFGDAATCTLLSSETGIWKIGKSTFGTAGKEYENLTCGLENDFLEMNGRGIFNFVAKNIPKDIDKCLSKNNFDKQNIDLIALHQGSKFIIDTLIRRCDLDKEKVPFDAVKYGNTVSSSIPLILANNKNSKNVLVSGFGVGLSWATNMLYNEK